ncbi:MAG: hypothetical protein ACR2RL_20315 [Gammaproteobacteria bacterium]
MIREVGEDRQTVIITQNGEAKAALQDGATYGQSREALALLELLAQGCRAVDEARTKPVRQAFRDIGKRRDGR